MTTRHTITHADEIYVGNAYKDGYSPDGRRGIKMTHLYLHKFRSTADAPVIAADPNGIFDDVSATLLKTTGLNWVNLATGALVSAGSTIINFDVPRNVVVTTCKAASGAIFKFEGYDQYGNAMAEAITVSGGGTFNSGHKCFKSITNIYCTAAANLAATGITIGTGNRLGLPFHLQTVDQVVSVAVNGIVNTSGATGAYAIHIGASYATTITSSGKQPDVRGDILFTTPAPDGTLQFTALIEVDHTTTRKAFGPPQASAAT